MRISDWSSDVCSSDLRLGDDGISLPTTPHCAQQPQSGARRSSGRLHRSGIVRHHHDLALSSTIDVHHPPGYCLPDRQPSTAGPCGMRSEEHTSELQSLMRISYAFFCLKKKKNHNTHIQS